MKVRNFTLFSVAIAFGAMMFSQTKVNSKPGTPPTSAAGEPPSTVSQTCAKAGCHTGGATAANASKFTLQIGPSSGTLSPVLNNTTTYTAGTTYWMSLALNGNAAIYGFEMIALDSANAMAGIFTATDAVHTQVQVVGAKQYFSHKNASATSSYIYKWTAPALAAGKGKVTFYYAADFSNGDGSENVGEDIQYSSSTVLLASQNPNGMEDISSKLSGIMAFPTVFSQNIQLVFDVKENTKVEAVLISLTGQAAQILMDEEVSVGEFNRSFNADNLATGIYLLKIQAGNASIVKKIIKL